MQNRICKLEAEGMIVGYTVRLRPQVEEQRVGALKTIAVEGNRPETALRALRGDPAVTVLYSTDGRWVSSPNCARRQPRGNSTGC